MIAVASAYCTYSFVAKCQVDAMRCETWCHVPENRSLSSKAKPAKGSQGHPIN